MKEFTREQLCDFFNHLNITNDISKLELFRFQDALAPNSNWLTLTEVAAMLKVSKRTAARYVAKGIIKKYTIGNKTCRYSKTEILEKMGWKRKA